MSVCKLNRSLDILFGGEEWEWEYKIFQKFYIVPDYRQKFYLESIEVNKKKTGKTRTRLAS